MKFVFAFFMIFHCNPLWAGTPLEGRHPICWLPCFVFLFVFVFLYQFYSICVCIFHNVSLQSFCEQAPLSREGIPSVGSLVLYFNLCLCFYINSIVFVFAFFIIFHCNPLWAGTPLEGGHPICWLPHKTEKEGGQSGHYWTHLFCTQKIQIS